VARGLIALDFGKGDRIGIWSTNNLEWILLQMATARMGAVLVNINPAYRLHELEYVLKNSGIMCLLPFLPSKAAIMSACWPNYCPNWHKWS